MDPRQAGEGALDLLEVAPLLLLAGGEERVAEGVLRQHMRVSDDFLRDSAYYAVLDSEWPEVKRDLEARLAAFEGATS